MRPLPLALTLLLCQPASAQTMVDRLLRAQAPEFSPASIAHSFDSWALPTSFDSKGNLILRLESNLAGKAPTIAFFCRLEAKGPLTLHADYDGEELNLPSGKLSVRSNPDLHDFIGKDLVTTDGRSPIANVGVVECLAAMEALLNHPEWKHGDLLFVFLKGDPPAKLDADFAFSLEGGKRGDFGDRSFNASSVLLTIYGKQSSPGYAKGRLVNAVEISSDFVHELPPKVLPENSNGGFIFPAALRADPGRATLSFQLRDLEKRGLTQKEKTLRDTAIEIQRHYPAAKFTLETMPSYQNLHDYLEKEPRLLRFATEAYRKADLTLVSQTFRTEADCIDLSSHGLPTGALFTGIENHNAGTEWLPATAMDQATEVILNLCRMTAS